MRRDPLGRSAQSFSDLTMNLLAILIVVTLVIILLIRSAAVPLVYAVDRPAERDRALALLKLSGVQRFSTHFYVSAAGVFEIDMAGLAADIASEDFNPAGHADLLDQSWPPVEYEIFTSMSNNSSPVHRARFLQDPGQYEIRFTFPGEPESLAAMPEEAVQTLVEQRAYQRDRTPNFFVAPSGFDMFASLEQALFAERRCFRWSYTRNRVIDFKYTSLFAKSFAARRCTR